MNVSCMNIMLNTAVAESFRQFADELEKVEFDKRADEIDRIVKREFTDHRRIIFNGNGYGHEWIEEAARRGLHNLRNTPEALRYFMTDSNLELFQKHHIYNRTEMQARHDITLDEYIKVKSIEAETMIYMSDKLIFPSVLRYTTDLAAGLKRIKELELIGNEDLELIKGYVTRLKALKRDTDLLSEKLDKVPSDDVVEGSDYIINEVVPLMDSIRESADALEKKVAKDYWPYPDYADILFYV